LTDLTPRFGISSPLFDKVTISLNDKFYPGKKFIIETENNSSDNIYIESMSVNGKNLNETFLPFSDVVKGGKMTVKMGNTPVDSY
jgi:putative alpha-1,2-mannosidase